jgi:hypothetical protein
MSGDRLVGPYEPLYASPRATYIFRGVMMVFSILHIPFGFTVDRGIDNIYYVSQIGGLFVAIYYVLAFFYSFRRHKEGEFFTTLLTVIFQLNAGIMFMIFVFYWPLISYDEFSKCFNDPDPAMRKRRLAIQLVQHLVYPVVIWFTLLMERTVFKMKYIVWMYLLFVVYCFLNYYKSSTMGYPVYDIINWKSMESHINLGGAGALLVLGFYLATKLGERMSLTLGFVQHEKNH